MAQDNEYVQKLIAARDREVAHRRDIAQVLAEKHNRGDMENMGEAFIKIQEVMQFDEDGVLKAFDLNRNLIYEIAAKVYERGRKGSYELVAADF